MLSKIVCIILILKVSILNCEEVPLHNNEKIGNLSIKYGNATEIHFQMEDNCSKRILTQLDTIQLEQSEMFAELNTKLDKLISDSSRKKPLQDSCAQATAISRRSGVYQILLSEHSPQPFLVNCDESTQGGGWTIILKRFDGSVNFFRYWNEYKNGFGNVNGEFFLGLEKLHFMTKGQDQELLITMEDSTGQQKYASYDRFVIGSEGDSYALQNLGIYSGDAGDSLSGHASQKFSSRDRDNDAYVGKCAEMYTGGWWYNKCHESNLMGLYGDNTYAKGINWLTFSGHNASLKRVQMMIRPVR